MILQDAILKKVIKFRRLVGFEGQENSVHERLYASESIELLIAESHAEKADALADMAVVMAGHYLNGYPFYNFERAIKGLENQAILNNVNLLAAFDIVMISNMSKVCLEADKNATTQKYLSEGVRLHWVDRDGQSACYSAEEYPDKPKGKLLKPVTYKKPDWSVSGWKILPINEHWNLAGSLPPTNTALKIKLLDGQIVDGIRCTHVKDRKGNLGYYVDCCGDAVLIPNENIKGWQYA